MDFPSNSDLNEYQQWLRTANTCPVCRKKVKSSDNPRKSCAQRAVTTPVANNGPIQNNPTSLLSRQLPSSPHGSIPSPNFLHPLNPARATAVTRRPPRPGRAETLPGNATLHEETHSHHNHPVYPYGATPHHFHATRHLPSRPAMLRPSPLQRYANAHPPQPQSYGHGPMREEPERFNQRGPTPTTEQLFLSLAGTAPPSQNLDNRPRPVFTGGSTLSMEESPPQTSQAGLGPGSNIADPPRIGAPASSVTFTAPPSSPPVTSRSDASSITFTQNHRTPAVYPHATSFSIDHANVSHHHVPAGPSSQVPHAQALHPADSAFPRGQDTGGRWHVHTPSTLFRDRPSGGSGVYQWWE